MDPELLRAIRLGLHLEAGADIEKSKVRLVGGGCIHRACVIEANPPFFVKVNNATYDVMFDAEWDSLKALAATSSIRVPCPLLRGKTREESFLVLEFLPLHGGSTESWQLMGEQLAGLHRCTSPDGEFGWHRNNFIGAAPQSNTWCERWIDFWREERLGFQLKLAADKGMRFDGGDRLLDRLDLYFTDHSPVPSLLHGDLWSGNASFTDEGKPVIYDPACYFGDRECDLAFTEMFGGFPRAFYDAYDATWPRDKGWHSRRDLYNLYHVLNHANLFGGSYRGQAQRMIHTLGAGS
jgi:fructosamine-3-kinase